MNDESRPSGAAPESRTTTNHTVADQRQLAEDAAKWRALAACPHVAELIEEWLEWHRRKECRESSNAIAGACRWGNVGPTYRELERHRNTYREPPLTPAQIKAKARAGWSVIDGGRQ